MKLIKLTNDHYIIVDDSEIDYDNEPYLLIKDDYETYIHKHKGDNKPTTEHYKITHSTQPLESENSFKSYEFIHLQEVKELIGEVNVKKKAINSWEGCDGCDANDELFFINGYQKGYNQALEDNKEKKYTEEDMRKAFEAGHKRGWSGYPNTDNWTQPNLEKFIQSLQPKTEWEVEFADGKLKLK